MATMMVAQMPVVMTPHVGTPAVFQQASPPWCTQTPESSPMLWGCAPVNEGYYVQQVAPMEKGGVSKEFLRSVCEPFFDQMLVAVQQALLQQSQQASQQAQSMQAGCWQPIPHNSMSQQGPLPSEEASTEDQSDIVSESGAFSCIFTPHSGFVTEEESVRSGQPAFKYGQGAVTKVNDESEDVEAQSREELVSEPPQGSDQDKSAMVCRHWKSKGWCRMEDNCKFLHPEHKRGVGFVCGKAGGAGGMNGEGNADMSNTLVHTCSSSDQLAVMAVDGKKKSTKKRKSKGKSGSLKEDPDAGQMLDGQLADTGNRLSLMNGQAA